MRHDASSREMTIWLGGLRGLRPDFGKGLERLGRYRLLGMATGLERGGGGAPFGGGGPRPPRGGGGGGVTLAVLSKKMRVLVLAFSSCRATTPLEIIDGPYGSFTLHSV